MLDESEIDPLVVGVLMLISLFRSRHPRLRIVGSDRVRYTFHFKQVCFFRFGVEGKPTPKTVDCGRFHAHDVVTPIRIQDGNLPRLFFTTGVLTAEENMVNETIA